MGEDTLWIQSIPRERVHVMADNSFFVAHVHAGNTSPKAVTGAWWHARSPKPVLEMMEAAEAAPIRVPSGPAPSRQVEAKRAGLDLSVVIPCGGEERLPLLAASLCALRQSAPHEQVVLVESGTAPLAGTLARRWGADHVFIESDGPFDRARLLNTGSALAGSSAILWCDGDLLFGPDFLSKAVSEFEARGIDYFYPFAGMAYLDETQSRSVREGTRLPEDCHPLRVLGPLMGGQPGAMGMVRSEFLQRHGGLIEGFVGWGGEDNAWAHKASLLGRVAVTGQPEQMVHHLWHPNCGATGQPWAHNPNYAGNLALFRRVEAARSPEALVAAFPHAQVPLPWRKDARIGFLVAGEQGQALAESWSLALAQAFGAAVPVLKVQSGQNVAAEGLDFALVFGSLAGMAPLRAADPRLRLIHVEMGRETRWAPSGDGQLRLPRTDAQAKLWRREGRKAWHRAWEGAPPATVAGPISLALASARPAVGPPEPRRARDAAQVPAWTYWEGPMPAWIAECLETSRLHLPQLQVLGPGSLDTLRDLDIDLSHLHVAQRADVIRAFLLARHGGLWVDADCIAMRDLAPLLARLSEVEAIAHRERQGFYSNAFLAIRPGSALAARFYDAVRARLRSGTALGWTSLGAEPLTELMAAATEPVLELETELVQPICWSSPQDFFRTGEDVQHDRKCQPAAWCYMLSNTTILRHGGNLPQSALTAPNTFFSYLVRASRSAAGLAQTTPAPPREALTSITDSLVEQSDLLLSGFAHMGTLYRQHNEESLSGPGSSLAQTEVIRRALPLLLQELGADVLLDAPCGDFNWMSHIHFGDTEIIGVDLQREIIAANRARHAAPGRLFAVLDILADLLPRADVVLCRDCLVHFSFADIGAALARFRGTGALWLLATTFPGRTNVDIASGDWRPIDLSAAPFDLGPPVRLINEKCTEGGGTFRDKSLGLWRLSKGR